MPLSKPMWQPPPPHPSSYQAPTTVGYLRFLYVPSSSVKTPLSSQVGNFVLIDAFNVISRVLSMVFFLRASCCFPAEKKTRSIPPPDAGQPWNCLHILTTSGYVWLTWTCIESLWFDISWSCWGSELFRGCLIAKTHLFLKRILIFRSSYRWGSPLHCHFNVIFLNVIFCSRRTFEILGPHFT